MKLLKKTHDLSLRLLHSGFKTFKMRVKEELATFCGYNLEDYLDDVSLQAFYRNRDSAAFVAATLWNECQRD